MADKTTPDAPSRSVASSTDEVEVWAGGIMQSMTRENFFKLQSGETLVLESGANASLDLSGQSGYLPVTVGVSFTEAGDTTYTGTIEIPAGAVLHDLRIVNTVLWDDTGAVTMKVGDDDDDNGWFTGINMKATDLVVGEVLSAADVDKWGGKEGVYLTSAGRMGRTTSGVDSGPYFGAASEIIGVVTTANQDGSAGRSFMWATFSVPTFLAATGA